MNYKQLTPETDSNYQRELRQTIKHILCKTAVST